MINRPTDQVSDVLDTKGTLQQQNSYLFEKGAEKRLIINIALFNQNTDNILKQQTFNGYTVSHTYILP